MIHHDPVGNLNRLALLVIIVANLVHVHALWNGITVYPQAGKSMGCPRTVTSSNFSVMAFTLIVLHPFPSAFCGNCPL